MVDYPSNFRLFNTQQTKTPIIAVEIEGIDDVFSSATTYTRIRYGMPGLNYGDPGLVYGGLTESIDDDGNPISRPYIAIDSGLTISQKVEPEQGRGSVSQLSIKFIDKDGYFSRIISRGGPIPDILGNTFVRVRFGYDGTAFPEDFFVIFRGNVSNVQWGQGYVILTISDANVRRRQNVFFSATTRLSEAIDSSQTSFSAVSTDRFYEIPTRIDGFQDTDTVKTYIKIDDEIMETGPGPFNGTFTITDRGARGTSAAAHVDGSEVINSVQLEGNAIDLALKIMLSGWDGYYEENVAIRGLGVTFDSSDPFDDHAIAMPIGVDAVESYGISVGDLIQVSGAGIPANDKLCVVTGFRNVDSVQNSVILVDETFSVENSPPSTCVFDVQSQYDTLPIECGLKLHPKEVDVARFQDFRNKFFGTGDNDMRFYITEPQVGKEFIEKECIFPIGAYSITRFGLVSLSFTKPPIADERLVQLDHTNVLNADRITFTRSLTNRRFYNEIRYDYDFSDEGELTSRTALLDADSFELFRQASTLPIEARGLRTDLGAETLISRRGGYLLRRYKDAAFEISVVVNMEAGSLIETGDVVLVKDPDTLKILDVFTGNRYLGDQLFEVIDRKVNLAQGNIELRLLSSIGFLATDRFGTISPSSQIDAGASTTSLPLKDSYGPLFPGEEHRKWDVVQGCTVHVHSYDYTDSATAVFDSFNPIDINTMNVSPALPFTPSEDYIVDIADYPTATGLQSDPDELCKLLFAHFDETIAVVSGFSQTVFSVSDVSRVQVGRSVIVRNEAWVSSSPEVFIVGITGSTIEVDEALGFTPDNTYDVELIYFQDGKGPYRVL